MKQLYAITCSYASLGSGNRISEGSSGLCTTSVLEEVASRLAVLNDAGNPVFRVFKIPQWEEVTKVEMKVITAEIV